jgi:hypothetical protein
MKNVTKEAGGLQGHRRAMFGGFAYLVGIEGGMFS